MKKGLPLFLAALSWTALAAPVKVIFDTDMYTDIDDVGALACLHAMADAGECEILATVSCTRDCMSVAMCEIVNAYYGRPDIPVGCSRELGVSGMAEAHVRHYRDVVEKFGKWVRHGNSSDAPDANDVYRRILAAQPDGSVVICSVGFLTNLRRLLETKPDAVSPLDGRALVAKKVKRWVAMACAYPSGSEYNSAGDAESSRLALENWPTEIVFSDFEYGRDCFAGRAVAESGAANNPVAEVFRRGLPDRAAIAADPALHLRHFNGLEGRAAWDETAVLAAVRGTDGYFNVRRGTYRMTNKDGENAWTPDKDRGRHLRLAEKTSKGEVGRIIDELMTLHPVSGDRAGPFVPPHARYADGLLSRTRPCGWLETACRAQREGLTGHPEALSFRTPRASSDGRDRDW